MELQLPECDVMVAESGEQQNIGQRHLLGVALYLGLCIQLAARTCINITVVGEESMPAEFGWSNSDVGMILSGFFYGYSVGQIPAGWVAARFGSRGLFLVIVVAASSCLLVPWLAAHGSTAVLAQRVVFGVLQSPMTPAKMALLARWLRPSERSRAVAFLGSSNTFGVALGNILSGYVVEALGWRAVFLVIGAASMCWIPLWHRFVWSSPEEHPRISAAERNSILQARQAAQGAPDGDGDGKKNSARVPLGALLSQPSVWAVLATTFTSALGMGMFTPFVPTYLHQQFGFSTEDAGMWSSLPLMLSLATVAVGAPAADRMVASGVPTTVVRKFFTMVAGSVAGLCSLLLCANPSAAAALVLLSIGEAGHSLVMCGYEVAPLDMTPEFASIVVGMQNTVWALGSALSSTLGGYVLDRGSCPMGGSLEAYLPPPCHLAWQLAFGSAGLLLLAGGVIFLIFGSADPLSLSSLPEKQKEFSSSGKGSEEDVADEAHDAGDTQQYLLSRYL